VNRIVHYRPIQCMFEDLLILLIVFECIFSQTELLSFITSAFAHLFLIMYKIICVDSVFTEINTVLHMLL